MPRSITFTVIYLLIIATPQISYAWDVIESHNIPAGANALCPGFDNLWCGYEAQDDSLIYVFSPAAGRIVEEHTAPENGCRGIGFKDNSFWFLGLEDLYHVSSDGELIGRSNIPYQRMKGLVGIQGGFVTMALLGDGYHVAVFAPDGDEVSRFRIGVRQPGDLAYDGENVWVTDPVEGFIHRIDMESGRVVEILRSPAEHPTGITYFEDAIYLTADGEDDEHDMLYKMDPTPEPNPRLLASSRYFDFGHVVNGMNLQWALTLFNVGSDTLLIRNVILANGNNGFRQLENINGVTIFPNEFITVAFMFEPREFGVYRDTILIASTDPIEPLVDVEIMGTGLVGHRSLNVQPDPIEFGEVRADRWRDGISLRRVQLINQGWDDLRIEDISIDIIDIFSIEPPQMPYVIFPAETLTIDMWFEPHLGIGYSDTLIVFSNDPLARYYLVPVHGAGDIMDYPEGGILWQHTFDEGELKYGSATPGPDINNDGFREVISVDANGTISCLNGFGSFEVDVFWSQRWDGNNLRPLSVMPSGCMSAESDLNGDGSTDVLIGSGGIDRAVYGVNGLNGNLLWRWDSRTIDAVGPVKLMLFDYDIGGDGAVDPVVMLPDSAGQAGKITRLDGGTGRPIWVRSCPEVDIMAFAPDLNRDGINEVISATGDGTINIYDGLNGGLLQNFELTSVSCMLSVNDIDGDGIDDMIIASESGGIFGYSVFNEDILWEFDREEPGANFGRVNAFRLTVEESDTADVYLVAAGTTSGHILLFDDLTGIDPVQVNANRGSVTVIDFHQDMDFDGRKDVIAGFEDGHVDCIGSETGERLWGFPGDLRQVGSIGRLFSFQDIDLGGSDDIVLLARDGIVRCVSSGGNLGIVSDDSNIPERSGFLLYPNPFNSTAALRFNLPEKDRVRLFVVDVTGRVVIERDLGFLNSGVNHIAFTDFETNLTPGGAYFFRIDGKREYAVGRGVLLK